MRSMSKNFESFKNFYFSLNYSFDVICISETWEEVSKPLLENSLYKLPCYTMISQPRVSGIGGGVAIYILENFE